MSVELTLQLAEKAFKELIAEGKRISPYAVEKRAGLSNALLSKNEAYADLLNRIVSLKASPTPASNSKIEKLNEQLKSERALKQKYYKRQKELEQRNQQLEAQNKELLMHLFETQRYLRHLEQDGVADKDVIDFSLARVKRNT